LDYFSSEKFDVLNIQMKAGETIPTHHTPHIAVVVVCKGEVTFEVNGENHRLNNDDIIVFEPYENHSLEAHTDVEIVVLKVYVEENK